MKKESTVKKVGHFIQNDTLPAIAGSRVTRDFLFKLVQEVGRESRKSFDTALGLPFIYGEKQLNSVIAGSLARLDAVFACESFIVRDYKDAEENGHGWVDYCVLYRDCIFLIEIKHGYMSIHSGTVTKQLKGLWKEACVQLRAISKEDMDFHKQNGRGVVKCSLLCVPHYISASNSTKEYDVTMNHEKMVNSLKPTWSALWELHPDIKNEKIECDNGDLQFWGVSFASKVYNMK